MATGAALTRTPAPEEFTASRLAKAPAPGISTAQAPVSGGFCALMTPEDVAKFSVMLYLAGCGQTAKSVTPAAANQVNSYFGSPFTISVGSFLPTSVSKFDHSVGQIGVTAFVPTTSGQVVPAEILNGTFVTSPTGFLSTTFWNRTNTTILCYHGVTERLGLDPEDWPAALQARSPMKSVGCDARQKYSFPSTRLRTCISILNLIPSDYETIGLRRTK